MREKKVAYSILLPAKVSEAVVKQVKKTGWTISKVVEQGLRKYFGMKPAEEDD